MTHIIGHRAIGAKETSLRDFEKAIELGIETVEFDLRLTGDGKLVVFHGPPGMEGRPILRDLSYRDICVGRESDPPLFSDVVDLCRGKISFDIELKEDDLLSLVRDHLTGDEGHLVTSFLDGVVLAAREMGFPAGLILGMHGISPKRRLSEIFPRRRKLECRADFLVPNLRTYLLSPQRSAFNGSCIWGANLPDQIEKLIRDRRVSAIITDKPVLAHEIRRKVEAHSEA